MSVDKIASENYIKQYQKQLVERAVATAATVPATKPDTVEISNKASTEKTIIKYGLFALGAAAIAGIIYYFSRGKANAPTSSIGNNSHEQKFIRQFFDKENNLVQGIRFDKGNVLMSNGNGFTGAIKTARPDGKFVELVCENGFIQESMIEGLFRKKYFRFEFEGFSKPSIGILREDFVTKRRSTTLLDFYRNGKFCRIRRNQVFAKVPEWSDTIRYSEFNDRTCDFIEFHNNGKKFAEGKNFHAKFFDENGKVIKTINPSSSIESGLVETTYDSSGNVVKEICGAHYDCRITGRETTMEYRHSVKYPNGSRYSRYEDGFEVRTKELPYLFKVSVGSTENNTSNLIIRPTHNSEIRINPNTGAFEKFLVQGEKYIKTEQTNPNEIRKIFLACLDGCNALTREQIFDSPVIQNVNVSETLQKALTNLKA